MDTLFQKREKYSDYNYKIYDLISPNKKVLDVGCATGKLLERLKKEKDCYTVGIEINGGMARKAKRRCDEVIIADVEKLSDLSFSDKFFDIIVFADALEHLKRPDIALKRFRKYLADYGCILISIPNVAFITVRLNLLLGRFNYTEYGLMDKTHLRFFTLKTVKKLIGESGYKIIYIEGYNQVRNRYFFLKPLGRLRKTLFATDFIIKAVKS